MIIGSCGFGGTGSSVITDFIREFDGIQVFDDFEFSFTYRVDGIEDLEYHLMKQYAKDISGDAAIKRFLYAANYIDTPLIHKPCSPKEYHSIVNKFVNSIVQTTFKGMESIDIISGNVLRNIFALGMKKKLLRLFVERWTKRPCYIWPYRDIHVCVEPENFYVAAKQFIRDILTAMGADLNKPIVLDQPFEGNAPENSFKFFDDPIALIVDRDPRDLFLEVKKHGFNEGRFIPIENVRKFVEYFKRIHTQRHTMQTDRILPIQFEDLIYNYEVTTQKVIKFCRLGQHVRKRQIFNPQRSINNTNLIRLYPEEKENVEYIEKELPEYLFHFENYKDVKISGDFVLGSEKHIENSEKMFHLKH